MNRAFGVNGASAVNSAFGVNGASAVNGQAVNGAFAGQGFNYDAPTDDREGAWAQEQQALRYQVPPPPYCKYGISSIFGTVEKHLAGWHNSSLSNTISVSSALSGPRVNPK